MLPLTVPAPSSSSAAASPSYESSSFVGDAAYLKITVFVSNMKFFLRFPPLAHVLLAPRASARRFFVNALIVVSGGLFVPRMLAGNPPPARAWSLANLAARLLFFFVSRLSSLSLFLAPGVSSRSTRLLATGT